MSKTINCEICKDSFDPKELKYYTSDGEFVLACDKCAKVGSLRRVQCYLCKSSRFRPEELNFFEIDSAYELVCGTCVQEHNLVTCLEHCSLCGARHEPKNLHGSSLDGEPMRVCDKCRRCSMCGNLCEIEELWSLSLDGKDIHVCWDCARCARCGEDGDPNEMGILTLHDGIAFVCSECAKKDPSAPSARETTSQ